MNNIPNFGNINSSAANVGQTMGTSLNEMSGNLNAAIAEVQADPTNAGNSLNAQYAMQTYTTVMQFTSNAMKGLDDLNKGIVNNIK